MNVVLFCDTYPPEINGVATSIFYLHQTLVEHGHKCLVVTTNPYTDSLLREGDIIRLPGLKLKKLYGYRIAGIFNRGAFEMIKEFGPDVIHINHDGPVGQFGGISAKRLAVPTVYTYHTMYEDYSYYFTKGLFDRAVRHIVQAYTRYKSNVTSEFIAPSQKTKDYLRSIGVDSYINVIPTGIDFSRFNREKEKPEETQKLRHSLGIADDEFVLLSLGRVAKEKSLDVVLSGFASYLKREDAKPIRLVIVGTGPEIDIYVQMAKDLGVYEKTVFVGAVPPDQTYKYYWLGDCFVSASLTETQGLTFMESMAASVPVLARYDDNLAGTISDRKTGFFFYDESDFGNVLSEIVNMDESRRKEIIAEALEAIDKYSLENFFKNVMEVYQRAVTKSW
ncbi:MAG: glycosyltransferase [Bacillota bacterium]|nr:glycosyltransferase [Bacillota bacterium]